MYVEFFLLDNPPIKTKFSKPSTTLKDAYDKLQKAVANENFVVRVETAEKIVILKVEPKGLNEFSGDRNLKAPETGYKQGSVIGLTIGMLFLGIVLGGMTINLVVSRKFGVSLFQGKRFGDQPFDNPLGESSM
ncbi:uncharacterized protein LOC129231809 [Uloborus diversus]|uniref:uncharacterized protein LOC129231809 n=1 Tax=Uloborus diversus TaxID=327109 RepID=UPI00240A90ED|nr:uncharacterized protein LOC129231809 [Uloborus diversus]